MTVETISYTVDGAGYSGALVFDDKGQGRRPLLLVAPNWLGVTDEAIARAQMLAGDRYVAFVADMYGGGKRASAPEEAAGLANGVRADPPGRRRRMAAALDVLMREAGARQIGDETRKAAVGFCFGGGNVLELARTGADLQAAICLHGDLKTPLPAQPGDIKAALLVLHGARDPVVPKADRDAFEAEMEAAGARWQLLLFGGLVHSFSESDAAVPGIAQYDEPAARQSFRLVEHFISDAFAGRL